MPDCVQNRTMDNCGSDEYICMLPNNQFGKLAETIHEYHKEWSLLTESKKLPSKYHEMISNFAKKCDDDPIYAGTMATLKHTPIANIQLSEEELRGEELALDEQMYRIVHDRFLIGKNFPENACAINSKFSVVIELAEGSGVLEKMNKMLPDELLPSESDSVDSILQRNDDCLWLDEVWKHGSVRPTNGDIGCRQCCRRTVSVADNYPSVISNPRNKDEEGRLATKMFVYPCREMPMSKWMVRPATNGELSLVYEIWRRCWPLLREPSRRSPPNSWQILVYQRALNRKMGPHRDNFERKSLKNLEQGGCPYNLEAHPHMKNSQTYGSSVIIYSFGNCPMRMIFRVLNVGGGAYQSKEMYEICPSFCFEFRQGYICILDPIDDIFMLHELKFEGVRCKGDPKTMVRSAMVMRWLENMQEFYADTSTIRLTDKTLKFRNRGPASAEPIWKRRNAWT